MNLSVCFEGDPDCFGSFKHHSRVHTYLDTVLAKLHCLVPAFVANWWTGISAFVQLLGHFDRMFQKLVIEKMLLLSMI